MILKGLSRLNPHCPKQASLITPDILLEFYKKLDVTEACDATFWCLFLHAFFLMSRKSNLGPNSVILPIITPGNACVVHPLIPSTYFGIDAEIIVALFSW